MFTFDNTEYKLIFNQKRLELIETVTKTSLLGEIAKNNGFLPYNIAKQAFSYCLYKAKDNDVVGQKEAAELFDKIVEQDGLATTLTNVVTKVQEDLGFLFR